MTSKRRHPETFLVVTTGREGTTGMEWGKVRGVVKYPIAHSTVFSKKNCLVTQSRKPGFNINRLYIHDPIRCSFLESLIATYREI